VGYYDESSFICVESFCDDREVSEVDMISWLIKDEESWLEEY
jgi:hypothetical protein